MKTLCFLFSLSICIANAQRKLDLRELKGTFKEMRSGYNFAYKVLFIDVDGETRLFKIDPVYGQSVLKKLNKGAVLTFKALVDDKGREMIKGMKGDPVSWASIFGESIEAIYLDGAWLTTANTQKPDDQTGFNWLVLLEKIPLGEIREGSVRKGFIFSDGLVAYSAYAGQHRYSLEGFQIGKPVSFIGYESMVRPEFLYPIENVKRVVTFNELTKKTGKIESFIYKQNFARIGLKLNGERYSFPAELAQTIEKFANNIPVTIYYQGHSDEKTNLLPTIQAFIQGRDTLKILDMYYGDPDGKHEHKDTELEGKITQVNRNDKGRIMSMIVGNDCYIEVDPRTAEQLANYLNKGKSIKIAGLERVKKVGEIYERNYRIITPQKVEISGKEFILNK